MTHRREAGYALVAAVAAVAAFSYVAFEVLATDRGEIAQVSAQVEHAKLMAAADAGLEMAVQGLSIEDPAYRWPIDGSSRQREFAGARLTIRVADERGKAPLSNLNEDQARALFEGAGASGPRLDALVDEYREWLDQDQTGSNQPAASDARPIRHGPFKTVDELIGLKDMDAALLARIRPAVTTFFEQSGGFVADHATPLAVQAMNAQAMPSDDSADSGDDASADDASSADAASDEQPAEQIVDDHLAGRALTVKVTAEAPDGGRAIRTAIVELTGDPAHPYYVRYVE